MPTEMLFPHLNVAGKATATSANNRFAKLRGEVLALSFAVFYLIWCGLTEVLQVKPQFLKPANR
ncbi:hypothetical protein BCY91_13405 [Pelobium manganitolerans]|uniref:Uncharacterized protein n=1 Tax=Pelobium manganitolerans TaxID=1842495 RepID=A0A419SAV8_9SPHI|nr:hypothetical protein BCY91_13405 [Pelobium manganitolerans]